MEMGKFTITAIELVKYTELWMVKTLANRDGYVH